MAMGYENYNNILENGSLADYMAINKSNNADGALLASDSFYRFVLNDRDAGRGSENIKLLIEKYKTSIHRMPDTDDKLIIKNFLLCIRAFNTSSTGEIDLFMNREWLDTRFIENV
jgi:hypothetical protein